MAGGGATSAEASLQGGSLALALTGNGGLLAEGRDSTHPTRKTQPAAAPARAAVPDATRRRPPPPASAVVPLVWTKACPEAFLQHLEALASRVRELWDQGRIRAGEPRSRADAAHAVQMFLVRRGFFFMLSTAARCFLHASLRATWCMHPSPMVRARFCVAPLQEKRTHCRRRWLVLPVPARRSCRPRSWNGCLPRWAGPGLRAGPLLGGVLCTGLGSAGLGFVC